MLELRASYLVPAAGRAATKACQRRQQNRSLLHPVSGPGAVSLSIPLSRLRQLKAASAWHFLIPFRPPEAVRPRRGAVLTKAAAVAAKTNEEKMTGISQSKLLHLDARRAPFRSCARLCASGRTRENSGELRNARANLLNTAGLGAVATLTASRPELSPWRGVCSPNNPGTALPGVV